MTNEEYENADDIQFIGCIYIALSEEDKIKVLELVEELSKMSQKDLSLLSDLCRVKRPDGFYDD